MGINGFDPLEGLAGHSALLRDVAHQNILNILKSYTGFYDLFAEALQNALDAIETKHRATTGATTTGYEPRVWIDINLKERALSITDNGVGMSEEELKLCFAPNVSFKRDLHLRGQKGVGATFLAYGFSFIKIQTKRDGIQVGAILRGGRQWAEDTSGHIPRPKLEEVAFAVPQLVPESSGLNVEIRLGDAPGEKPKQLDWQGATSAQQWLDVLRIKTPLGAVYLNTPPFHFGVTVRVTDNKDTVTEVKASSAEYYYPHEIPGIKVQDLEEVRTALAGIPGDPQTKQRKLADEHKRLNCIYAIWGPSEILGSDSSLGSASLSEEDQIQVNKHNVIVYGAFVDSTKIWDLLNDQVLHLREGYRILRGGLQMASDFMVQGELITIPLTKAIGYQNNTHVIVHFTNGNPDLGRKTFQPEHHELAERLASQAVKALIRYRSLLRPDTGSVVMAPDKDLHEWKKHQENWREQHSITLGTIAPTVAILSEPRQEQDVVALYHELIGAGIIKGIKFFGTTFNDRYDGLVEIHYPQHDGYRFHKVSNPLGVGSVVELPYQSEPKVLEYKFDLDALVEDVQKEEKFLKHLDLVVCWRATGGYESMLELKPLLVGEAAYDRVFFGSTHAAYRVAGASEPEFEVVILEDLLNYLLDPATEEARQKTLY